MNQHNDNIALLIDSDNASHNGLDPVLTALAELGTVNIRRAYGNWRKQSLKGWVDILHKYGIEPQQQFDMTKGKNATDMKMTIDAMDLLYAGNVEAFALVTSDSDFTSLALRLRESGKVVYGLGGAKTPASLQNACDRFIRLESLGDPDPEADSETVSADATADEPSQVPEINLQSVITKAVNAVGGDDGWAAPGPIGQHLSRTHPSLDPRNYDHRGLQGLLAAQPYLETTTEGGSMHVRVKGQGHTAAKASGTTKPTTKTTTKTTAKKQASTPKVTTTPGTATKVPPRKKA